MRKTVALLALAAALGGCAHGAQRTAGCGAGGAPCVPKAPGWRDDATPGDRDRMVHWRDAWDEGFDAAKAAGHPDLMTSDALFDPDRALETPLPPAGAYRCRMVKLGSINATVKNFTDYPPVACAIAAEDDGTLHFAFIDGQQRPDGILYPEGKARGMFLGTLVLADESRPFTYGRDATRDLIGYIERIGDHRWRMVLPYPHFESKLDVIEIIPAV
jgi:hypothetical protein